MAAILARSILDTVVRRTFFTSLRDIETHEHATSVSLGLWWRWPFQRWQVYRSSTTHNIIIGVVIFARS